MKYNHLLSIAMVAVAIGACFPLEDPEQEFVGNEVELVFDAELEANPETKTAVQSNGKTVWWSAHEEISIFYGDSEGSKFTSANDEPVAKAQFQGTLESFTGETESGEPNSFWAIYPYDADSSCDGSSVTTTLPASQTAKAGTFADKQWLTLAKSYGLALSFKNVCSGFYFTVTHPGVIKATLKGNNNETLAGKIKISTDSNGIPVVQEVLSGQKEIVLSAPQGETFAVGEKYYFTFLPQTFIGGFTITLETSTEKGVVNINKSVQFKRSDINWRLELDKDIPYLAATQQSNEIWYKSSNGQKVTPFRDDEFGAVLKWNVYQDGQGRLIFDAPPTEIGTMQFYDCATITEILLPEGITSIGYAAFAGCTSLEKVQIPATLNVVDGGAGYSFNGCTKLSSFTGAHHSSDGKLLCFQNGTYQDVVASALYGLTSYTIDGNVGSISNAAFSNATGLQELTLGSNCYSASLPPKLKKLYVTGSSFTWSDPGMDYIPQGCEIYGQYASSDHACWVEYGILKFFSMPESYLVNGYAYRIPNTVTTILDMLGTNAFDQNRMNADCCIVIPASVTSFGGMWTPFNVYFEGDPTSGSMAFPGGYKRIYCHTSKADAFRVLFSDVIGTDEVPVHGQTYDPYIY